MNDLTCIDVSDPLYALLAGMDERRQQRLKLRQRIMDEYIPTTRDKAILDAMTELVDLTISSLDSEHPEGRILAITGESGAGKTWAIEHAIQSMPGLDASLLRVTSPGTVTLMRLGRQILHNLDYDLKRELKEHRTWELVTEQLEANRIRFLWIDEFQHTFEEKNRVELQKIKDTVKNLAQSRTWPIGIIISGLPVISKFLVDDRQIERRSSTVEFNPIQFPSHIKLLRQILDRVIVKHAEMTTAPEVSTDEFAHRLTRAAGQQLGVTVTLIRQAVLNAFDRKDFTGEVTVKDFATAYAAERGCDPTQNVFLVENWSVIDPKNSRNRQSPPETDSELEAGKPSWKRRK